MFLQSSHPGEGLTTSKVDLDLREDPGPALWLRTDCRAVERRDPLLCI